MNRICVALGVFGCAALGRGQTDPTFEGIWVGEVIAPNATTVIGFAFTRGPTGLTAKFAMPAMFVPGLNLGPAKIVGETYEMPELGIKLTRAGKVLTGTFANPLLRVEVQRGSALPAVPDPAAAPPAPAAMWSRALSAPVWGSPVARNGFVYLGDVAGNFHAIRAIDGAEEWTWRGRVPLWGEALATDDAVYFLDEQCALVCLGRTDGHLKWRMALSEQAPAPANPTFNHRTAVPVIEAGTLYVGSVDGTIFAIEAATGKVLWRRAAGAPIYSAVAIDGEELVAGCYDGTVLRVNRRTHQETARTRLGGAIASAPVVAGGTIVVGCRDYLLYGLQRANLAVSWRDSFWFSWVESTPNLVDGAIYIGGSDYRRVSKIDPASGVADWTTDVGGLTWGTPVVTAGTIFAGTSAQSPAAIKHTGGITALDRHTGRVIWRHVVALTEGADRAGYLGSLVLCDGLVIGAGYDGRLVAFPAGR
ncbi:MAG TPA: PQQ-binding-like beta-propeller repeat protein [Opitutaceae bacterium]|nr:PQQ-binding-like beta-propeller repeat protein [Opitutaceae bacterium]